MTINQKITRKRENLDEEAIFELETGVWGFGSRVLASKEVEYGHTLLVASGPKRYCKYDLVAGSECQFPFDPNNLPECFTPRIRLDMGRPVIAGVAWARKGGATCELMDPSRYNKGSRWPPTFVRLVWGKSGETTWETRTVIRKLFNGKAVADRLIFEAAKKFDRDAEKFMREYPKWPEMQTLKFKKRKKLETETEVEDIDMDRSLIVYIG